MLQKIWLEKKQPKIDQPPPQKPQRPPNIPIPAEVPSRERPTGERVPKRSEEEQEYAKRNEN